MTPQEVFAKVDALVLQVMPQIEAKADAFFTQYGRYWQGLVTHEPPPLDGVDTPPTVGATAPHDQPVPWSPQTVATPLPMAIRLDVYDGPVGLGYLVTFLVRITPQSGAIETWARALGFGPLEAGLTHGRTFQLPEPEPGMP